MKDFPDFMKSPENLVPKKAQSKGVKGWVYEGLDGKQMAYWICETDGISKEHVHDFDEYFIVVQGRYTLKLQDESIDMVKGDGNLSQKCV